MKREHIWKILLAAIFVLAVLCFLAQTGIDHR